MVKIGMVGSFNMTVTAINTTEKMIRIVFKRARYKSVLMNLEI